MTFGRRLWRAGDRDGYGVEGEKGWRRGRRRDGICRGERERRRDRGEVRGDGLFDDSGAGRFIFDAFAKIKK